MCFHLVSYIGLLRLSSIQNLEWGLVHYRTLSSSLIKLRENKKNFSIDCSEAIIPFLGAVIYMTKSESLLTAIILQSDQFVSRLPRGLSMHCGTFSWRLLLCSHTCQVYVGERKLLEKRCSELFHLYIKVKGEGRKLRLLLEASNQL